MDATNLEDAARILGKRGGKERAGRLTAAERRAIASAGGIAANERRSPNERREIARRAARARWEGRKAARRINENARRVERINYLRANVEFL